MKKDMATIIENKILYCKINKRNKENAIEPRVPDHVLLGLIFGTIKGPLKYLPIKKADVSLINDNKIIKKNNSLSRSIKMVAIKKKFKINNEKKYLFNFFEIKKEKKIIT